MDISCYKLVSIGYAAQNKALSSNELECIPIEMLPYIDGELNEETNTLSHVGIDSQGNSYTTKAEVGNSLGCTWLQWGSNRVTAPDVRRGELVFIWQYADEDFYYWTSPGKDDHLRRLETVIWAFSGTKDETIKRLTPDNSYVVEISTHKKLVTLTTSKANGEPFAYTVQINAGEGGFVIMDDNGQFLELDSKERSWTMTNQDGSIYKMDKDNIYEYAKSSITRKTKAYSIDCDTLDVNATTSITTKTATHSASASAKYDMLAPISKFTGKVVVTDLMTMMGGISAVPGGGTGTAAITIPVKITAAVATVGTLTNNGVNVGSTHQHNETGMGAGVTTPPL